MEATRKELQKHTTKVNAVLQETCDASAPAPLVRLIDGTISLATSCPSALSREVVTDLGVREIALRLPIPDGRNPRFWIAMQEQWDWKSKNRVCFRECGLRLYVGDRTEEAVQFLRLEWAAPICDNNGVESYQGKHAGHPHWHVDRPALIGQEEYFRSLDALTAPAFAQQGEAEEFNGEVAQVGVHKQPLFDFSWLQQMHLPARAQWMDSVWDGRQVPGPHQCQPNSLDELSRWGSGALRYVAGELPR
jgi:hypothetical protein